MGKTVGGGKGGKKELDQTTGASGGGRGKRESSGPLGRLLKSRN